MALASSRSAGLATQEQGLGPRSLLWAFTMGVIATISTQSFLNNQAQSFSAIQAKQPKIVRAQPYEHGHGQTLTPIQDRSEQRSATAKFAARQHDCKQSVGFSGQEPDEQSRTLSFEGSSSELLNQNLTPRLWQVGKVKLHPSAPPAIAIMWTSCRC